MSNWIVRVSRFDGSKVEEQKYVDYPTAQKAFESIEQLQEADRESAGGRVRLLSKAGIAVKVGYVR